MLGSREPETYGSDTLTSINYELAQMAEKNAVQLVPFQSNTEGDIVNSIQQAVDKQFDFIIINPAAYTHTSIAIRDAFLATRIPFIETHLSNVHAREEFRTHSYLSDIAVGVICGFGKNSYLLALQAAILYCNQVNNPK